MELPINPNSKIIYSFKDYFYNAKSEKDKSRILNDVFISVYPYLMELVIADKQYTLPIHQSLYEDLLQEYYFIFVRMIKSKRFKPLTLKQHGYLENYFFNLTNQELKGRETYKKLHNRMKGNPAFKKFYRSYEDFSGHYWTYIAGSLHFFKMSYFSRYDYFYSYPEGIEELPEDNKHIPVSGNTEQRRNRNKALKKERKRKARNRLLDSPIKLIEFMERSKDLELKMLAEQLLNEKKEIRNEKV